MAETLDLAQLRGNWLEQVFARQRGHLFHWAPVLLAIGIGLYFLLRFEPNAQHYIVILITFLGFAAVAWGVAPEVRAVPLAFGLVLIGVIVAGTRAHMVAEPVLGFRYYGPIEGRILNVDRSASDKVRLTLDQVVMERMAPDRTPANVRISLHGDAYFEPAPGLRIMTTGHLSPPQGPVEPGGFDFRRMAWFQGLGAVGYTRSPVLLASVPTNVGQGLRVHRLRLGMSNAVQTALPGRTGAFAAAVTTGDRSGMDQEVLDDLRASNLAHLLAISGLHMGLLTGFVFAAIRVVLALFPWIALRAPVKKIAAVVALGSGAFYYMLSGGNVATERAFIMVAVMFTAILFDRRAITLRAVAIAAVIVLVTRPETLISPGFQMSFAATTALVAVFGALRDWKGPALPKLLRPVMALVVSSAVAGLATAPVAAAHFNRISDYGLIANLLSVPLMGLVVMPGAVLAAVLAPLGLSFIGLALMKPGIDWILWVAGWVADLEGSTTAVVSPQLAVLPVMALGALWVILWQGRARFVGVVPFVAALILWSMAERPPLLVSESGGLLGVMTDNGRALNKGRGDGFSARTWLENDGDNVRQDEAFARNALRVKPGVERVLIGGAQVVQLSGRGAVDKIARMCDEADIIVIAKKLEEDPPCLVHDAVRLRATGALAIYPDPQGLRLVAAKTVAGKRLWSGAQ